MMLLILLALAGIPLLGVIGIAIYGSLTTVDGLFMSLILLAMSGILGTTALFELRNKMRGRDGGPSSSSASTRGGSSKGGDLISRGRVQEVTFYESNVGQPNKSIIMLIEGAKSIRTLVLEGDLRNALPIGQKVEIVVRKERGQNVLASVSYP
jgi:hypothetical protein